MGLYLNAGFDRFKISLRSQIYVDKSELIACLNEYIGTEKRYLCVSRPRRFGKSVTAGMLCAYYSKDSDSSPLFDSLRISHSPSYKEHLNQHNTIFINMQVFLSNAHGEVSKMLAALDREIIKDLSEIYPQLDLNLELTLNQELLRIYSKVHEGFIFIIDEWDCIMREAAEDAEGIKQYLDYLRALLKDQPYVSLAYMTGILPIKKYGSNSALNMFDELSMTEPGEFVSYLGFTDTEVEELCRRYEIDFSLMQQWYDGYSFRDCPHLYNPNSVVRAIQKKNFRSYWTQTETFEALRKYIELNLEGLRDEVIKLVAGEEVVVNTVTFHNDMTTFEGKDDVLTLLIHLGYLALVPESIRTRIDNDTVFAVKIPNREISNEFRNILNNNTHYKGVYELIQKTDELLDNIYGLKARAVADFFNQAHQEHTSILKYNDENSLSCVVALSLLLSTTDTYTVYREQPSGKGFADLIYLPKRGIQQPALLIELKYDNSAESALTQIKKQNYLEGLRDYQGEIILVGLNYSPKTKEHQCIIEKLSK